MSYRITSLERIDGDSLPVKVSAGMARWKALVEFWDGEAQGDPPLSDDFIVDFPTQRMRPASGDDWELVPKHEHLVDVLHAIINEREPHYLNRIQAGERGYLAAGEPEDQHGTIKTADAIAHHPEVRKLLGVVTARPKLEREGQK